MSEYTCLDGCLACAICPSYSTLLCSTRPDLTILFVLPHMTVQPSCFTSQDLPRPDHARPDPAYPVAKLAVKPSSRLVTYWSLSHDVSTLLYLSIYLPHSLLPILSTDTFFRWPASIMSSGPAGADAGERRAYNPNGRIRHTRATNAMGAHTSGKG